jgi:hypothetical protein
MLEKHPTWDVIDSSKIQNYLDCPRMYFYRYILGWKSALRSHNDLEFGRAWHKGMAYLAEHNHEYSNDNILAAYNEFLQDYRKDFSEDEDALFQKKNASRALSAYVSYADKWPDDSKVFETIYVEIAGSVSVHPELPPIYFRIDTLAKLRNNGKIIILERKTGTNPGQSWSNQWLLKTQVGTYLHVAHCLFPEDEIFGALIDGTFFGTKTKFNHERVEIKRDRESMQVWSWNTIQAIQSIIEETQCLEEPLYYKSPVMECFPMNTESCSKYWGCTYHNFCTSWANPLQRCDQPELGLKQEFWDPREEVLEAKTKVEL